MQQFRFGVNLGSAATGAQLLDCARLAEDLGYAAFSLSDHLAFPGTDLAPLVSLAAVAAVTRRIELQPLVLANDLRHPAVLAKEAATLDLLSGGRCALGLGAGWYGPDFQAPGIPFHRPGVRIARLAEAIAILRGLHRGDPFDFHGEYFRVTAMTGTPRPLRSPLPLLLGGSGPKMLALAVREADTVALTLGMPLGMRDWRHGPAPYAQATDRKRDWIRAAAAASGTAPEIQTTVLAGGITDGGAEALLAPLAALVGATVQELAGCPHVLAGSVAQCIETLLQWRERWGISYVTLPAARAREFAPVVAALHGR